MPSARRHMQDAAGPAWRSFSRHKCTPSRAQAQMPHAPCSPEFHPIVPRQWHRARPHALPSLSVTWVLCRARMYERCLRPNRQHPCLHSRVGSPRRRPLGPAACARCGVSAASLHSGPHRVRAGVGWRRRRARCAPRTARDGCGRRAAASVPALGRRPCARGPPASGRARRRGGRSPGPPLRAPLHRS